jgi:hypothetical protein
MSLAVVLGQFVVMAVAVFGLVQINRMNRPVLLTGYIEIFTDIGVGQRPESRCHCKRN